MAAVRFSAWHPPASACRNGINSQRLAEHQRTLSGLPLIPFRDGQRQRWSSCQHARATRASTEPSGLRPDVRQTGASAAFKQAAATAAAFAASAALVFSAVPQAALAAPTSPGTLCQLAALPAEVATLPLSSPGQPPVMMGGMTSRNFDPVRYQGRWYEVASLKKGFAGQGQEDCHCTQGVYSYDPSGPSIGVDTFCVHGSPTGYMTGIRGRVQCLKSEQLANEETSLERLEMVQEKCFLRFPSIPFIPKEPYDVIATDYDNYALVSGAKDLSFVQIYSRTPKPGREFIDTQKQRLAVFGYNIKEIRDTPQDCPVQSMESLERLMSRPGMAAAMENVFPTPAAELPEDIELPQLSGTKLFQYFKTFTELFK